MSRRTGAVPPATSRRVDAQLGDLLAGVLELDLEDAGDLGREGERDRLARLDVCTRS